MSKLGVPEIHDIMFTPDKCIIKKWIDTGLIQDRYKCYLTYETCVCENIDCYWLEDTCKEKKEG